MNDEDIRPVVWVGDAREQVQSFPKAVRSDIGAALYDVQLGEKPPKAKPFKGAGSGVLEIVTRFDTDTYRTVYAVKIGRRVYVLHAFQKKSPKGRKTAKLDVEMIARRYKEAGKGARVMKKNGKIAFEESSGNVFADLGLDDADELLTRAKLGHSVRMILVKKKLKQREIGKLLEIKQPEVSNLMNGRYTLFSPERLFGFLNKLDRKVTVQVSRRRKNEPLQEVVLA